MTPGLSFAQIAALFGLIGLALPILAHLVSVREPKKQPFPSLSLLYAVLRESRRRTRLQRIILLLLRMLALTALVLLFAQPSISWVSSVGAGLDPSRPLLVMIDGSASMAAPESGDRTRFDKAKSRALELLEQLDEQTPAAVVSFGSALQRYPDFESRDAAMRRVGTLSHGNGGTDLARALEQLVSAVEVLSPPPQVRVLGDGTITAFAAPEAWPSGVSVHYENLAEDRPSNAGFGEVVVEPGILGDGSRPVTVALRRGGEDPESKVRVDLAVTEGAPGAARISDAPVRARGTVEGAGPRRFTLPSRLPERAHLFLQLPDDDLPADNTLVLPLTTDETLHIAVVSGDESTDPRKSESFFLSQAIDALARGGRDLELDVLHPAELGRPDRIRQQVLIITNLNDPAARLPGLTDWVSKGGGLVLTVGNQVDDTAWNQGLGELLPAGLANRRSPGPNIASGASQGLAPPPWAHPFFEPFRAMGMGPFSGLRVAGRYSVNPNLPEGAEVLMTYDDGMPALLSRQVGDGRVLLLTTSIDTAWNDFPVHAVYTALVDRMLDWVGRTAQVPVERVAVGDVLPMPRLSGATSPADLELVTGERVVAVDRMRRTADGRVLLDDDTEPGLYTLRERDARALMRYVVEVPPAESALQPLSEDAWLAQEGWTWQGRSGSKRAAVKVQRTRSLVPELSWLMVLALGAAGVLSRRWAPKTASPAEAAS